MPPRPASPATDPPLSVVCNPYAALDVHGHPVGVIPRDHTVSKMGGHIGASRTTTFRTKRAKGDIRSNEVDCDYSFDPSLATQVPSTDYYKKKVKKGELLAGNEATARACGIDYVPPAEALCQAKKAAVDEYVTTYGVLPACAACDEAETSPETSDGAEAPAGDTVPAEPIATPEGPVVPSDAALSSVPAAVSGSGSGSSPTTPSSRAAGASKRSADKA